MGPQRPMRPAALALCCALAGCSAPDGLRPVAPPAPEVSMAEGHRLMAAGDAEGALSAFRRAAVEGTGPEALAAMGTANLALGRLGQAEPLLRRALERDPTSVAAWNNLGTVLLETDRAGEAEASFRRAFALDGGATPGIRDNLMLAQARREGLASGGDEGGGAVVAGAPGEAAPGAQALP